MSTENKNWREHRTELVAHPQYGGIVAGFLVDFQGNVGRPAREIIEGIVRPSFADHMAERSRYNEIAQQLIDLRCKYDSTLAKYRNPDPYLQDLDLRGDKVRIEWKILWAGGEHEHGDFEVPVEWFDNFNAEIAEAAFKAEYENEQQAANIRRHQHAAEQRQQEIAKAVELLRQNPDAALAAGLEVVPLDPEGVVEIFYNGGKKPE